VGRHGGGQAQQDAAALLRRTRPGGPVLANGLFTALGVKEAAHYGTVFVAATVLRSTLRSTTRLVAAAEAALQNRGA
jgi:hypothetical protein